MIYNVGHCDSITAVTITDGSVVFDCNARCQSDDRVKQLQLVFNRELIVDIVTSLASSSNICRAHTVPCYFSDYGHYVELVGGTLIDNDHVKHLILASSFNRVDVALTQQVVQYLSSWIVNQTLTTPFEIVGDRRSNLIRVFLFNHVYSIELDQHTRELLNEAVDEIELINYVDQRFTNDFQYENGNHRHIAIKFNYTKYNDSVDIIVDQVDVTSDDDVIGTRVTTIHTIACEKFQNMLAENV